MTTKRTTHGTYQAATFELDLARSDARHLAFAALHDTRPDSEVVARAMAYPGDAERDEALKGSSTLRADLRVAVIALAEWNLWARPRLFGSDTSVVGFMAPARMTIEALARPGMRELLSEASTLEGR